MTWTEEEYQAYLSGKGQYPEKKTVKSKYKNKRTNGHASKHEDDIAAELHLRERAERINVLEQVPFVLAGGVSYVADFVILYPGGSYEVIDAKGMKTDVYKIKAKQMDDLWNIKILEV